MHSRFRVGKCQNVQVFSLRSYEYKYKPGHSPASVLCVAWDTGLGAWTDSGCSLVTSSEAASVCRCDQMTAFALMLSPSSGTAPHPQVSSVPIMTLQIVTYIVAGVSVLCVVLILVKVSKISL